MHHKQLLEDIIKKVIMTSKMMQKLELKTSGRTSTKIEHVDSVLQFYSILDKKNGTYNKANFRA